MPALSPRTMSFGGQTPTADQIRPMFEQGFTQMAYDVLIAKLPHLSEDVVTFKILDVDPDEGRGAGTFVVRRQGQTIYVPVVMADNQLKPLDIMYHKDLNVFVPLSKDWLEQVDKSSLSELGEGMQPPTSVSKDVDIRQVVVPPVTGRFSYASDTAATPADVFKAAYVAPAPRRPAFLEYLSLAPNRVKKAAALVFEQNPKVLRAAVRTYGATKLAAAFKPLPEKTADYGGRLSKGGGLYVADENTPADIFKDVFGPNAPLAYQNAVSKGYAAKDTRATKRALRTVTTLQWTSPDVAGAYKFVDASGKPVMALAVPAPINLFQRFSHDLRHNNATRKGEPRFKSQCAVTENGVSVCGQLPIGERLHLGDLKGTRLMRELTEGTPRVGASGFFMSLDSRGLRSTEAVKVKSVSTDSKGYRRVVVTQPSFSYSERELVFPPEGENVSLLIPANERLAYLPNSFKFVSFTSSEQVEDVFLRDVSSIQRLVDDELVKSAAEQHVVRHSPATGWTVNAANRRGLKFAEAIEAVARQAGVHADVAATLVKEAAETGRVLFWAVPENGARRVEAFLKVAAGQPQGAPPPQDPSQMDPSQMAPPPPPMPTPVDMAVAEQTQSIMGQMQALQQQLTMLQMVQQRSQQIAGGGGAMAAPEAMAAAMGGPVPMGPQGVNPMLAGPGPQGMPQGMPPGMGPSMMAGGQPGMDPSMMGGGQPMVDPQTGQPIDPQTGQPMEPPPPAMMSGEAITPEELAAQVNPQFLEQAGNLQDEGAFDAAALASMAQGPSARDLISAYVPNLERALDNLGRVMLTLYLEESKVKEQIGNGTFVALEDNLRNTFKGLGELLLKINQTAVVMQPGQLQAQGA